MFCLIDFKRENGEEELIIARNDKCPITINVAIN